MSNACFAARRGRHKAFPYISTRVIVHRLLYRLHFQTGVPPLLAPTFLFFSPVQDATCSVAREAYADNARAHINRGLQPRVSLPPAFFEKPPFAYTHALSLSSYRTLCASPSRAASCSVQFSRALRPREHLREQRREASCSYFGQHETHTWATAGLNSVSLSPP